MGVSSCLLLDASVDAAVLTVVGGRVVDGCACGVARSGESNGAVDGLLFVCSLHRGDFEAQVGCSEAKRRVSVLRCLCAAAFASIGAGGRAPVHSYMYKPTGHPGGFGVGDGYSVLSTG